jgi:phage-related protein
MQSDIKIKSLIWVGGCKKDLLEMPDEIQDAFGFALHEAQIGGKSTSAKPLKGFGSAGVLEIVENFDGDTYRAVYTVRYSNNIYVLHCFQKKSTKGISTPKPDLDKIQLRLKAAEAHAKGLML